MAKNYYEYKESSENEMYEDVLTIDELAKILQVTRHWIQRKMKEIPPLPCMRKGRKFIRFDLDEVKEWMRKK